MRTLYAVGDVHGCRDALGSLLDAIAVDSANRGERGRPRVVLLGDLVDRGPDSSGVLELLCSAEFEDRFDATLIRGNHDECVLDVLDDPESDEALAWLMRHGGAEMLESYGIDLRDASAAASLRRFVDILPRRHRALLEGTGSGFREGELYLVHGGIDPRLALADQDPAVTRVIRHGFLDHPGPFEARVVHGHSSTRSGDVEVHPHRIAVDTGAGFHGCRLSAAAIRPDGSVRAMSASTTSCATQLLIPA